MTSLENQSEPERLELDGLDGIAIRELWLEDAPRYFELVDSNRTHLSQNHNGDPNSTADSYKSVEDVVDTILNPKNPNKKRFGIWVNGVMVGTNNLTPLEKSGQVESGSWVAEQYAGHHYAAKARELLKKIAFEKLGYRVLVSEIAVGNEASRKSIEKSGYKYKGIIQKPDKNGTLRDYWHYELEEPEAYEEGSNT